MKRITLYIFCCLGLFVTSLPAFAKKEGVLPDLQNPGFVEQPSWFKQSFLDVKEDIDEAAEQNKRVMYFFYQDGCPYCKKLITVNFAQKNIVKKTRQKFDVIAINMWGDNPITDFDGTEIKEKDFAAKYRVMFTPTILFFNEKGEKVLRLNGYYPPEKFDVVLDYVSARLEEKVSFKDYLSENRPQKSSGILNSQSFLLKAPFDMRKLGNEKKYHIVMFEQKDCPECDELHRDILKRKETVDLMTQFDVIQLDMWSKTPVIIHDGTKKIANEWSKELNVQYAPTLVLFDNKGKEVIRMEAYLKSFHVQSIMDYVLSQAYLKEPSFQRYIDVRAEKIRDSGVTIELMN